MAPVVAGLRGRYRADGVPLMLIGQWELLLSIGVDHLTLPLTVGG